MQHSYEILDRKYGLPSQKCGESDKCNIQVGFVFNFGEGAGTRMMKARTPPNEHTHSHTRHGAEYISHEYKYQCITARYVRVHC